MQYRNLGRSALKVSELCLGTMNFGPRTEEAVAFEMLDLAVSAGVNFIDTADQYGGALGVGSTEQLLGRWFARSPSRRAQIVLATKVHEPMSNDINDRGLSARHIVRACEASLLRLGVDYIDLYQMHHIDRQAPMEEIWQAMDRLITQGKIVYVGSSNFPGWGISATNERRQARGQFGLVSEQGLYNLLVRTAELEVIPACQAYGVGLLPWSPLAGGALAGPAEGQGRRQQVKAISARHADQIAAFEKLCQALGHAPSKVAHAWLLAQPGVASVILGSASKAQLANGLEATALTLDSQTLGQLDEIFPPMGKAPEAYAW
jgi:NDP-hexose 2,3-enoyl reductase